MHLCKSSADCVIAGVGVQHEFKFINGTNWEVIDSLDGQSCVFNFGGFVNRIITTSVDTAICFEYGRCATCDLTIGIHDFVQDLVTVRPTRINGGSSFEVRFLNARTDAYRVEVMDLMGKNVFRQQVAGSREALQVNTSSWTKGIYFVRTSTKTQHQTVKVLVE